MKEFNILRNYLLYFLLGLIICLVGVSNVFAEEIDIGYVSNKTQVLINVPTSSSGAPITLNQNTTNTYGMINQMWVNVNNQTITKDYTYMLEIYTPDAKLNEQIDNVVVRGTSDQICQFIGLTSISNAYPKIYFKCPVNVDYISVELKNTQQMGIVTNASFRWSYTYLRYYTEDNDIDLGPVISNQTANTNNIINNDNTNTQNIINNQNSNTNKEIESQKVCTTKNIDKDNIVTNGYYLNSNGNQNSNSAWGITDYIELSATSIITLTKARAGSAVSYCFYDSNKTKISCEILGTSPQVGDIYTIPANTKYVRFSINKNDNNPQYEISNACINGNQAINDSLKEQEKTNKGILAKISDLFNTLFSNENADISGLDNMVGWLPAGPLDSIINLPLALFNALANTLTGTCQSVTLTLPFVNKILTLPCFDSFMSQYINGFSTLWALIGGIVTIFILYNYLLSLYKWVDDTLTLRENNLPGYYDDNWGGGA